MNEMFHLCYTNFFNFIEMATFNIEIKQNGDKSEKLHPLMLRLTEKRQHARIKLIYSVSIKEFNPKARNGEYIRSSNPKHKTINQYLANKLNEARDAFAKMEKAGEFITAQSLKEKLLGNDHASFIEFTKRHIAHLEAVNHVGSYKKYTSTLNLITGYINRDSLFFREIDVKFLRKFEEHLLSKGKKQTTIRGYFVKIRALFNMAIADGIIDYKDNPFNSFRIKQGRVEKDRLTLEEINNIESLEIPKNSLLYHIRNLFLLSFYSGGMRISDSLFLQWSNIKDGRITYIMHKTGKRHSIKISEPLARIIHQYPISENESETDYVFPIIDTRYNLNNPRIWHNQLSSKTALVNKYLKTLAIKAEINKRITTHTARHSFADIVRQKTDNLYNLSKALGHSSIKITEAYLASFDEKAVDDTLDEIFK